MEISLNFKRFFKPGNPVCPGGLVIGCILLIFCLPAAFAGPYPPAAGKEGSSAIHKDDPAFVGWATGYENYLPGTDLEPQWQIPEKALGKAVGDSFDIVSMGRGGRITMTFDPPIENGEGWDFAVFENAIDDRNLELGYVEVSSNGEDFIRFDNVSLTPAPVDAFGTVEPSLVDGLAGKYRQGYGTPFDLEDLSEKSDVQTGVVDLSRISHVRIIDIIGGDENYQDSEGNVIYDPYPTRKSAGFDLDAIGVSNGAPYPEGTTVDGELLPPPETEGDAGFGGQGGCFISTVF